LVAAGILASRVFGLVRQRVIAHYLGQSTAPADAYAAAFRIPNFLQNLFGEGVLSASFIPEYTRLVASGDALEARRLAGAVASLLAALVTGVGAAGAAFSPALIDLLAPGFEGPRRDLAVTLTRILFPSVGLLVLSAWCLGVLNSHRRFLLSYAAPVGWNAMIIAATLWGAARGEPAERIVRWTVWGALAGSLVQLLAQLPLTLRLLGGLIPSFDTSSRHVQAVLRNFGPAFVSRGVVQISAFLDTLIASLLPLGAVAALTNAQMLYLLPVSLFGMSVAAAELPELAVAAGDEARTEALRERLARGSSQVAFFIVPCALGFLGLGHVMAGVVYQGGAFTRDDAYWVWGTLAAATVGLLPQALGRLLTTAYFALGDTRTTLRFATLRVSLALALGLVLALAAPRWLGLDPKWGTAGLALAGGLAGLLEYALLRRALVRRVGTWHGAGPSWLKLVGAAAIASLLGWAALGLVGAAGPVVGGLLVLGLFGLAYLGLTAALRVPEALFLWHRARPPAR
jgi:putative peptidoglycan lipid II flippase